MHIGAMNHPRLDVIAELRWMKEFGLDFVDLTLEPPAAAVDRVDLEAIKSEIQRLGLGVVGHTAYYLPMCCPFENIRRAAVEQLAACLEAFAFVGARWMNVHPDRHAPMHDRKFIIEANLKSFHELMPVSKRAGVGMMIENLPGEFNTVAQLAELLDPLPELGLHLDIGHANLQVQTNTTEEIMSAYGKRLRHVHLHDNKGGYADLHLPLGTGSVDYRKHLATLKSCGYDGTITLEVFSPDKRHFQFSRDVLRRAWDDVT
jgi:sugar phosphate isomerase/epimerase